MHEMDDKHEADEDDQCWLNTEAETGEPDGAGDAEDDKTRLLKSAVHEEYLQTSETVEVKSKNGKKTKVTKWKSSCKHCPKVFEHKKQWGLKRHLMGKHPDVSKVVEDIDDCNREEQRNRRDKSVISKHEMEGNQEADATFTFTTFVKNFVSDIIDCQSFQACDIEVKQRIKHLLFVLNFFEVGNFKQFQSVLQDNKILLDDINDGAISWTSELYFKAWQQRVQRKYHNKVHINAQSNIKLETNSNDDDPPHVKKNDFDSKKNLRQHEQKHEIIQRS